MHAAKKTSSKHMSLYKMSSSRWMRCTGIDPGTVRLVAQRLNHYATRQKVKCKTKVHARTVHEDPEDEYKYIFTFSLTSALDVVGG